jgi:predicted HTH domain antitoxin
MVAESCLQADARSARVTSGRYHLATANIPLPDSVNESEARLLLAIKLFEIGRLSCGQAAELAGYSKRAFMEILGREQIPVFNYPADEIARDLADS